MSSVKVTPIVTDPNMRDMRSNKSSIRGNSSVKEGPLRLQDDEDYPSIMRPSHKGANKNKRAEYESDEDADPYEDSERTKSHIFNSKNKTKEECNEPESTNMMLIIVFALVVIALVALIVWMVMKQNEPKKIDEMDMKDKLRPNPRNMMPPVEYMQQMQHQQMMMQEQARQEQARQLHLQRLQQQQHKMQENPKLAPIEEIDEDDEPPGVMTNDTNVTPVSVLPTNKTVSNDIPRPVDTPKTKEVSKPPLVLKEKVPVTAASLNTLLDKTNKMMNETVEFTDQDKVMLDKFSRETFDNVDD
jgi:flagellar basal body-associated protein FliL